MSAKSFVSDRGEEDISCDWNFYKRRKTNHVGNNSSHSQNLSTVTESSTTPSLAYGRRKRQTNPNSAAIAKEEHIGKQPVTLENGRHADVVVDVCQVTDSCKTNHVGNNSSHSQNLSTITENPTTPFLAYERRKPQTNQSSAAIAKEEHVDEQPVTLKNGGQADVIVDVCQVTDSCKTDHVGNNSSHSQNLSTVIEKSTTPFLAYQRRKPQTNPNCAAIAKEGHIDKQPFTLENGGKANVIVDFCHVSDSCKTNHIGNHSSHSRNLSTVTENSTTPFLAYQRRKPQTNPKSTAIAKEEHIDKPVTCENGGQADMIVDVCHITDSCKTNHVDNKSSHSQNLSTVTENSSTPFLAYQRRKSQTNPTSAAIAKEEHIDKQPVTIENVGQADVIVDVCHVTDSCITNHVGNNSSHSQNLSIVAENSTAPFLVYQRKNPQINPKSTTIAEEEHIDKQPVTKENDGQADVIVDVSHVTDSCSSSAAATDENGEKEGVVKRRLRPCINSCLRSCKACNGIESTLKMLICDSCEQAFHISCCYPRLKKMPGDEWYCSVCLKKKQKILKQPSVDSKSNSTLSIIESMMREKRLHQSTARVGDEFQATVPDWSGPIIDLDETSNMGEPLSMSLSERRSYQDCSTSEPCGISYIGNWVQCCAVIDGFDESINGTICGKWRRAPLFETQNESWECFRSFIWDPTHADCAVPQELETEEVLKQLKYVEMLRPRLAARRRKVEQMKRVNSKEAAKTIRHKQTTQ